MIPSEKMLIAGAEKQLRGALPPGWDVEKMRGAASGAIALRFISSEGRSRAVPVVALRRVDPRTVRELPEQGDALIVAPYLSKSVRSALDERRISYVDQVGTIRVVLNEPGLFISTPGEGSNPWPEERSLSLRGVKAGRVVRALVSAELPIGVRDLAERVGTNPGYVSRLLQTLDRQALVERSARGQVEAVDWRGLLARWAEDAPLEGRAAETRWLAPRGISKVLNDLASVEFPYLLTGSAAAGRLAPVAPTRLLSLYVDDPYDAAERLGLRETDAGANVVLLQPEDEEVFSNTFENDRLQIASLPMIVADSLSGGGRAPAEASSLMNWMEENQELWRGRSIRGCP